MNFIIDANLSEKWVMFLEDQHHQASYWPLTHPADAPDLQIIHFAAAAGAIILTQDLDFGMHLADLKLSAPSVIQLRSTNTNPEYLGVVLLEALKVYKEELTRGLLITVDLRGTKRIRVNELPLL